MQKPASAHRRVAHALAVVAQALTRAREEALPPHSQGDLDLTLSVLETLRSGLRKGPGDHNGVHLRPKGLNSAPDACMVAVISLANVDGAGDWDGGEQVDLQVADVIARTICERIALALGEVTLGRFTRTRLEISVNDGAHDIARRLLTLHHLLEAPIQAGETSVLLDVAIGYAVRRQGEATGVDVLLRQAEHALAKSQHGPCRVTVFSEDDRLRRAARTALMRDLRDALSKRELFVCYQPKLDLRSMSVSGVEALVRWTHPARGPVPPDEFVGMAEEGSEIRSLTEFVVQEAIARRRILLQAGQDVSIAVNISAALLADESFTAWAQEILAEGCGGIGFEITETAVIANPDRALANIRALAGAGVSMSIDDYGAGLSSLIYLQQIPADELKIDKAFVTDLTSSHRNPLLVRSTIDLGHALGMKVTAEGVDNARALALLQVMGCDMIQGYHVSRPLGFDDLLTYLRDFDAAALKAPSLFAAAR